MNIDVDANVSCSSAEVRRAEDATFQKNNLQRQLREVEHSLQQKQEELTSLQKRFSASHGDIMGIKMENESLKEKLEKVF